MTNYKGIAISIVVEVCEVRVGLCSLSPPVRSLEED
jgi:hypothetical protein